MAPPALRRRRPRRVLAIAPDIGRLVIRILAEPAALVAADGEVEAANDAWRAAAVGPAQPPAAHAARRRRREPAARGGPATGARRRPGAEIGPDQRRVHAHRLEDGRFLMRLTRGPSQPPPPPPSPPTPHRRAAGRTGPALDAFAAASPFGAALIEGEDAFAGPILEVNAAWAGIAGEACGRRRRAPRPAAHRQEPRRTPPRSSPPAAPARSR